MQRPNQQLRTNVLDGLMDWWIREEGASGAPASQLPKSFFAWDFEPWRDKLITILRNPTPYSLLNNYMGR